MYCVCTVHAYLLFPCLTLPRWVCHTHSTVIRILPILHDTYILIDSPLCSRISFPSKLSDRHIYKHCRSASFSFASYCMYRSVWCVCACAWDPTYLWLALLGCAIGHLACVGHCTPANPCNRLIILIIHLLLNLCRKSGTTHLGTPSVLNTQPVIMSHPLMLIKTPDTYRAEIISRKRGVSTKI